MVEGHRVQRSLETTNKKLAEKIEAKLKLDIAEGKYLDKLPGETKTLHDLRERFLREHGPRVGKMTVVAYKLHFNRLTEFFGDIPISQLTPRLVSEYKQKRLGMGRRPATVNREMSTLSKALNIAKNEWEWIRENPLSRVQKEREDNKRQRWLLEEEEKLLLAVCPDWLRDVVTFAIYTGMRQGEIINLEWKDVDMFRKCVILLKTKNKEPRTIPLADTALEVIKRRSKFRNLKVRTVFLSVTGGKIEQAKLGKKFRRALEEAGITNFRFHDLRHTFGSRLAQAGADLFHIARLMGHKNISTTMRYLHHSHSSLVNVVKMLNTGAGN
jgi:integrase